VIAALATPLSMGVPMMCVRRALDQPISFSTAFSHFSRSGTALAGAVLVLIFSSLGTLAPIIPGIYLINAYQLTTQLICDQGLSAGEAMRTGRRAITHRWWSVFALQFLVALIVLVSGIFGILIPLVWTVPWAFMTTAVLYRRIFYASTPSGPAGPPPVVAAAPA
jgi:uncharacterized membrane protein